ncbi:hypothetical protein QTV49_000524 [Vibrio vulnificus]|nr:hypothetical protein [Vibrio vulnificus]
MNQANCLKLKVSVITLNDIVNSRADRSINVRNALGTDGLNTINGMFQATETFLNDKNESPFIKAVEKFISFLAKNPAKKESFFECLTVRGRETVRRISSISETLVS